MILLVVILLISCNAALAWKSKESQFTRPDYVREALSRGENLYYFGLGSNMLRSKVESRSADGKINILSMQAAVVHNHRLAFNMRGFVPIEPGMGSLEPLDKEGTKSRPLLAYDAPECHGALILLDSENYNRVMMSEGVSHNATNPGYEEVVVDAYPYGSNNPVKAVALRARPHVRLRRDPAPSVRYMTMLRQGAAELGLVPEYQDFLARHPVQNVPQWLRRLAINNFVFTIAVSTKLKTRALSKLQSRLLFCLYNPRLQKGPCKLLADSAMALVLLPGSLFGCAIRFYFNKRENAEPPFLKRILSFLEESDKEKS